jgi:hypothetical protein
MTLFDDRTAGRCAGPVLPRLLLFIAFAFAVTACGVKNDLVKPNGQAPSKDEHDSSKPPFPLGH